MYETFYGLRTNPFQLVSDPDFLYRGARHEHALTYLEHGLRERAGFILLTGEAGTGKTTLIRHMLNLVASGIEVALIPATYVGGEQLLRLILREFGLPADGADRACNRELLQDFLLQKRDLSRGVLLVIDEAQNLPDKALEEVRMLSNLQAKNDLPLQIVLVGQPELKSRLKQPGLAQLAQRIAVNYHLMPLERAETGAYIAARLAKAGGDRQLFSETAVNAIHRAANGMPRAINLLCHAALIRGFADESRVIDGEIIAMVLDNGDDAVKGSVGQCAPSLVSENGGPVAGRLPRQPTVAERLGLLEAALAELIRQVEGLRREMEKLSDGAGDAQVWQLKTQLERERRKNDELLREYGRPRERPHAVHPVAADDGAGIVGDGAHPCFSGKKTKKPLWFFRRF